MLWHCFVVFHKNICFYPLHVFWWTFAGSNIDEKVAIINFYPQLISILGSDIYVLTSQLLSYGWKWHFLAKKHHTKLLQVHRNWEGGRGAQPPRFGLNLTFYQLMTIIDKSKKEPKNINHISNSLKTTGSFTLFHVM